MISFPSYFFIIAEFQLFDEPEVFFLVPTYSVLITARRDLFVHGGMYALGCTKELGFDYFFVVRVEPINVELGIFFFAPEFDQNELF